jgi:hypothetical protein
MRSLHRELVFVDQAAEQVAPADAIEISHYGDRPLGARRLHGERRPLPTVGPRATFGIESAAARVCNNYRTPPRAERGMEFTSDARDLIQASRLAKRRPVSSKPSRW